MNDRNLNVWFISVLTALALYLPFSSGNRTPSSPNGSDSALRGQSLQTDNPKTTVPGEIILRRFLGAKDHNETKELSKHYDFDFLIATVPDPKNSGLSHIFDRHVAAIQWAAETAEYILERPNLPWSRAEADARDKTTGQVDLKLESLPGDPRKSHIIVGEKISGNEVLEPGVILFRGRHSEAKLLFVFLVGETPTSGIDKSTFRKALGAVQTLCSWGKRPRCGEKYKLLAPTFSGSVDSLRIAITDALNRNPDKGFEIVSGSATAIDKESQLPFRKHDVTFSATVMRDEDALCSFLKYLDNQKRLSPDLREVALLQEASTAYGTTFVPKSGNGAQAQTPQSNRATRQDICNKVILRLTYPLHISQLRRAAERARATAKKSTPGGPSVRPRNLRLSLEEDETPKDIVSPFSTFDVFSVELILSKLLTTIAKERIFYVGIFSTDIRDQLFLVREIKKHTPNVTLFTVGADLTFLHSDVNLDFQGMLVITTYPLFSMNQVWSYPFTGRQSRLQFPDHTAQGVYNATLALLDLPAPKPMLEYGGPFEVEASSAKKPRIWLSVVGSDNIWPIKIIGDDEKNYLFPVATNTTGEVEERRFEWRGLHPLWLVCVLALVGVITLTVSLLLIVEFSLPPRSSLRKLLRVKMPWIFNVLGESVFLRFRLDRRLYLMAFSFGLLTIIFIVVRLLERLLIPPTETHCSSFLLLVTLLILAPAWVSVGSVVMRLCRSATTSFNQEENSHSHYRASLISVAMAPPLIFVLAGAFANEICGADDGKPVTQFFLYLRMLNPGSGLSPLLPLLFVAATGLLWVICSLLNSRRIEEATGNGLKTQALPFLNFTAPSFADLTPLENDLSFLIRSTFYGLPTALVIISPIAAIAILLFTDVGHFMDIGLVRSFEPTNFYRFFGTTFTIVYLTLAVTFVRFLQIWWATRRLLHHLSWHPFVRSFASLPSVWPAMPQLGLIGPFKSFTGLETSINLAGRLARVPVEIVGPKIATPLHGAVAKAETLLSRALLADGAGNWKKAIKLRYATNKELSMVSSIVAGELEPHWRLGPGLVWKIDDKKKKQWLTLGEQFLAARAVTYLSYVFSQLQCLIFLVVAGLLLMLMAVTSYPFQPKEWLLWFNWLVIFSAVILSLVVFVQMGRNRILSLLSNTTPGEVNWNKEFILKILIYVIFPTLALLGAQFPEGLRQVVSWFSDSQGTF